MYYLKLNWYCKGLNITEVAHDNSASVKSYIVEDLQLKNSYDTWHGKSCKFCISFYSFIGTKNVAKAMTKIATGAKMRAGITWFSQNCQIRVRNNATLLSFMKYRKEYKDTFILQYEEL